MASVGGQVPRPAASVSTDRSSSEVDRKSTRLNSSHQIISYAVFCLKKKINVESEGELDAIAGLAKSMGRVANVALRVNPDLPPKTHAKTDTSVKGVKFGLDIDTVLEFAGRMVDNKHVRIVGLHMHLSSPILKTDPYKQGLDKAPALIDTLRHQCHH